MGDPRDGASGAVVTPAASTWKNEKAAGENPAIICEYVSCIYGDAEQQDKWRGCRSHPPTPSLELKGRDEGSSCTTPSGSSRIRKYMEKERLYYLTLAARLFNIMRNKAKYNE